MIHQVRKHWIALITDSVRKKKVQAIKQVIGNKKKKRSLKTKSNTRELWQTIK